MSFKKTILLGCATAIFGLGIYYFEFVRNEKSKIDDIFNQRVLHFEPEDINFLQIQNKDKVITLQKTDKGWQILEPIQDVADASVMQALLKSATEQTLQSIESQSPQNLTEYGLVYPASMLLFKNNQGQSLKIQIGTQKNFEGLSFAKINDDIHIKILQPFWEKQTQYNLTHFREKKLYRDDLSILEAVKVKSLNDTFTLIKQDQKWVVKDFSELNLDQNLVRQAIKDLTETTIQDYLFEGDPSEFDKKKKGLLPSPVHIEFESATGHWSASLNLNNEDKAFYALTSRPTFLVSLDMSRWEKFANLTLDSLRDRKSMMTFSKNEVQKIFVKDDGKEYNFSNENQTWILNSKLPEESEFLPIQAEKILNEIHDLEVSEFIDLEVSKQFVGNNMVILRSASDQLIFQLNWGPLVKIKAHGSEKNFYLARTQLSKKIFAIDKQKIDDLRFDKIFKKTETAQKL
jgi:hypothetical protein